MQGMHRSSLVDRLYTTNMQSRAIHLALYVKQHEDHVKWLLRHSVQYNVTYRYTEFLRISNTFFFFCSCHILSVSNDVIIFLFVWIKKRTYFCRAAPKEFLRRRRCHLLQTLLLKTLCSSSSLLFLETDSRPRTLALWLTHLPADKLSGTRFPPPMPVVPVGVKKLCEQ